MMPRVPEVEVDPDTGWSEWFWTKRDFTQICCHCGLAHQWQFKIIDGKLHMRVQENKRSTAAARRKRRK